jgi:hypothetical protein
VILRVNLELTHSSNYAFAIPSPQTLIIEKIKPQAPPAQSLFRHATANASPPPDKIIPPQAPNLREVKHGKLCQAPYRINVIFWLAAKVPAVIWIKYTPLATFCPAASIPSQASEWLP